MRAIGNRGGTQARRQHRCYISSGFQVIPFESKFTLHAGAIARAGFFLTESSFPRDWFSDSESMLDREASNV
jgi:hypothetical protein